MRCVLRLSSLLQWSSAGWWFPDAPEAMRPDVATASIVAAVLGALTLIACVAPAARAARVNPAVALGRE